MFFLAWKEGSCFKEYKIDKTEHLQNEVCSDNLIMQFLKCVFVLLNIYLVEKTTNIQYFVA